MPSSTGKPVEELSDPEKISVLLSRQAKECAQTIMVYLDTVSPAEKLTRIQAQLNSANPEQALGLMMKLADEGELRALFAEPGALSDLLLVLNSCCFTVNQQLKGLLSEAITQRVFKTDLDSDFAQAAASLQSKLCRELCASYGDQIFTILHNRA